MSTPFFYLAALLRATRAGSEAAKRGRRRPGPTCQAAECAGTCGDTARNPDHRKGGLQMAKKAKGAKKKAAKKR